LNAGVKVPTKTETCRRHRGRRCPRDWPGIFGAPALWAASASV